ncbi:uncharacterized protein DEA37_0010837 [Paragonimus westermani]|uniref:Uncharacterized protein n=1 Tax=Paragonimus westermani TaxID=34504 RepID=A0A5J4N9X1_9TREM|nr:uncharacterized protein DEA37_0010837 [Paragonimus westermani]
MCGTMNGKVGASLSKTKKHLVPAVGRRSAKGAPRRRNWSTHTTSRLSPCPEEELVVGSAEHNPTSIPDNHTKLLVHSRPCSPPAGATSRDFSSVGATHLLPPYGFAHRPVMPPGPPTSPVPSPPPPEAPVLTASTTAESSSLTLDLLPDILVEDSPAHLLSTRKQTMPNVPAVLRNCLRRRRNAISGTSALGQGLKEFFASYVMSHLTESMTSSLTLDANPVADLRPQQRQQHPTSLLHHSRRRRRSTPTVCSCLATEMDTSPID